MPVMCSRPRGLAFGISFAPHPPTETTSLYYPYLRVMALGTRADNTVQHGRPQRSPGGDKECGDGGGRGLATDENGRMRIELRVPDRISAPARALPASGSLETAPRNRRTRGPERQQLFARKPATAALLSVAPSTACGRTLSRGAQ
ncbi:hypothetical protein NDU88_005115 [Pleurodeles waltl]|uniref:Uncharacterized protein n=1 Tax=Pleurodeles waltl TaxID=8319 RepID=A0AAV7MWI3_PLEWA|nr:hypothetical protein NDU88_005115 [Pleurodeles waltl]